MYKFFTIYLLAIFSHISEIYSDSFKMKKANLKARHRYIDDESRLSRNQVNYPISDDELPFSSHLYLPWDSVPNLASNPRKPKKHRFRNRFSSPLRNRKRTMFYSGRKLPLPVVTNHGRFTHFLNESPRIRRPSYEDNPSKSDLYNANRRTQKVKFIDEDDIDEAQPWNEDDDFYARRTPLKRIHGQMRHEEPDETYERNTGGLFKEKHLQGLNKGSHIEFQESEEPGEDEIDEDIAEYPSREEISTDSDSGSYLGSILQGLIDTSKPDDLLSAVERTKTIFRPNDPARFLLMDLISATQPKKDVSVPFAPWYLLKKLPISNSSKEPYPAEHSREMHSRKNELPMQRKTENNVAVIVEPKKPPNYPFRRFGLDKKKVENWNSNPKKSYTLEQQNLEDEDEIMKQINTPATIGNYEIYAIPTTFNVDEEVNGNSYSKTVELSEVVTSGPIKLGDDPFLAAKNYGNTNLLDRILNGIENEYSEPYHTSDYSEAQDEFTEEGKSTELGYNAGVKNIPLEDTYPILKLGEDKVYDKSSDEKSPSFFSKEIFEKISEEGGDTGRIPQSANRDTSRTLPRTTFTGGVKLSDNFTDDNDGKGKQYSKKGPSHLDKDNMLMTGFVSLLKQRLADLDHEDGDTDDDAVIRYYERKLQLTAVFTFIIGLIILGILLMSLIFRLRSMNATEKTVKKTGQKKWGDQKKISEKKLQNMTEKEIEMEILKKFKLQNSNSLQGLLNLLKEYSSSFSDNMPEKERSEELQKRLLGSMLNKDGTLKEAFKTKPPEKPTKEAPTQGGRETTTHHGPRTLKCE